MYEAGGISRQEAETAYAAYRESQANLQQLTSDLSRMSVVSPINGIVIRRDAEVGQLSNPSRPLFEVADMSLRKKVRLLNGKLSAEKRQICK